MPKFFKKTTSMRVLMISFDRKILTEGNSVRTRIIKQGKRIQELHVIVFSCRKHSLGKEKISENVWVYPTNSLSRWLYIFDACRIGKNFSKIDLVTAQNPAEEGLAGLWLARKLKSRLQVQVHTDFLNRSFLQLSFLNRIRLVIALYILPKADCVRVVSDKIKQELETRLPVLKGRVSVLPVFIDASLVRESSKIDLRKKYPQFDYIIISASRLEKGKNIDISIQALAYVCRKYPKTGLILLGEGREEHTLVRLIRTLGMDENVVMFGWVSKVASYMRESDLLLSTSGFEGYGMTIVEARLLGLSVVSTDVGVAREVGADIISLKPEEIAEKIILHIEKKVSLREPYDLPYENEEIYLTNLVKLWEECV